MKANCSVDACCNLVWGEDGVPVLVSDDGNRAYGPDEAGAVNVAPIGEGDADACNLIDAARIIGYEVYA